MQPYLLFNNIDLQPIKNTARLKVIYSMFTTRCTSKTKHSRALKDVTHSSIYNLILSTSIAVASAALLAGCGQKGDLYLVDSGNQAIKNSTAILDSGSNPQDAAFAKIDDNQNNEQNADSFQLPEPSTDPNDY